MTSLMTSRPGTFPLTALRAVAATARGRMRLKNMLTNYMAQRDRLDPRERNIRDLAALRFRHVLRETASPTPASPAPTTGAAA